MVNIFFQHHPVLSQNIYNWMAVIIFHSVKIKKFCYIFITEAVRFFGIQFEWLLVCHTNLLISTKMTIRIICMKYFTQDFFNNVTSSN